MKELFDELLLETINSSFRDMEIAEELIREMMGRCPEKRKEIWNAFPLLRRTEPLRKVSDRIYRVHVEELLNRIVEGKNLGRPTAAEVASVVSQVSLAAPVSFETSTVAVYMLNNALGLDIPVSKPSEYAMEIVVDETLRLLRKTSPKLMHDREHPEELLSRELPPNME